MSAWGAQERSIGLAGPFVLRRLLALVVAMAIFAVNTLTPMHDAVAVLYALVVMLVADFAGRRMILSTGFGCAGLAVVSFLVKHWGEAPGGAHVRLAVSLTAIGVATLLAMRARQARLRLAEQVKLLAITHETVIVRDPDGFILDWNEGATQLYGWTRSEAVGRQVDVVLQTRYHDGAAPILGPGDRWSGEITRMRRDRTPIDLSSRWLTRLDENGHPAGIIELSADRTEQRLAEQARARARRRYGAIFRGAGVPILEATLPHLPASGLILREGNEAAARLLAMDRAALPGLDLFARLPSPDAAALRVVLLRLAGGESVVELPVRLENQRHRMRDIVLTVSRAEGEDDGGVVLLAALDVTDRNAALRHVERMRADLAHAARVSALGQMTAAIAHEVNQPLQATATFARSAQSWLNREPADLAEAARCLTRIVDTTARAARVVERIRAMIRGQPMQRVRLDLAALLGESLAILDEEVQRHAIVVHAPKRHEPLPVRGDRTQLQQVVVNILLNAMQAMAQLPPERRVLTLTLVPDPDLASLVVEDCGDGFTSERLEHAFDPFHSDKSTGFGIGLSVCRAIMDAHDGQIEASNRPEGGARVAIRLQPA